MIEEEAEAEAEEAFIHSLIHGTSMSSSGSTEKRRRRKRKSKERMMQRLFVSNLLFFSLFCSFLLLLFFRFCFVEGFATATNGQREKGRKAKAKKAETQVAFYKCSLRFPLGLRFWTHSQHLLCLLFAFSSLLFGFSRTRAVQAFFQLFLLFFFLGPLLFLCFSS
jgi:hypothetical protein